MTAISDQLNRPGFLKNLFEAIPCGVLVMDQDRRIQAVNDVLEHALGISEAKVLDRRGGEALGCVHAKKNSQGCGYADECQTCVVRNTALEALSGDRVHRQRAKIQLLVNGKEQDLIFLVSAAPLIHEGERFVIVILEDVTELNTLRKRLKTEQSFAGIIGRDARMNDLFERIRQVSSVDIPVFIQGESGTGKELVAAAIHNEGPRANKSFVPVNCGALPEGLLESELFGHVKGAFTGALRDKKGRFELAHRGTLFLDEVVDLPKAAQSRLLRILQEGAFERVGDERTVSVDVRIISAANRDLKREVEKGNFREDLYYRINVIPIHMPPLRERKKDIPILAEHFLSGIENESGRTTPEISEEAMSMMMDYQWPGNVRELENAIHFAVVRCRGKQILPDDLPMELRDYIGPTSRRGPAKKLDADMVKRALVRTGGNKAKAARLLGVGRATLYRFLEDFPGISQEVP